MSNLFLGTVAGAGDLVMFTDVFDSGTDGDGYDVLLYAFPPVVYARLVIPLTQRSPRKSEGPTGRGSITRDVALPRVSETPGDDRDQLPMLLRSYQAPQSHRGKPWIRLHRRPAFMRTKLFP